MKKITNSEWRAVANERQSRHRRMLQRIACSIFALYGVAAYALNAPSADETFTSNFVYVGGVTRMKIALHNNNATDVTGVQVSDTYPAGMSNASGNPVVGNTCGGTVTPTTNPQGFTFSGGTLHSNGCEIVVNVTGTQAGVGNTVTNTTSAITSSNAPPGPPASATLSVAGAALLQAPDVTLTPFPDTVTVGGNSTLMLAVSNPNVTTVAGAQFAISYPTPLHLVNVSSGALLDENLCSSGETVANGGDATVLVTNFSIPGGGACVFFLEVVGASSGTSTIHTGNVLSANATMSTDATASLTVNAGALSPTPTPQVTISPSSVRVGGTAQVKFDFINNDPSNAITGMRMESLYGLGLANAPNALVDNSCGGFVILHPHDGNTSDFHLLGGSIPAGSQCSVIVNITGTQAGFTPSVLSSNIRSANAAAGGFASGSIAVTGTPLMSAASASEAFAPPSIQVGDTSQMTITLTNPNAFAITGAQFNDYYPTGIHNAPGQTPSDVVISNTCGGAVAAEPDDDFVGLSNGTIPPLGSCAVIIKVAGTSVGQWINSTGSILAANALTGNPALSGLSVEGNGASIAAPTVSKSFADPSVLIGNSTQMKISVQNNDGANSVVGLAFTDLYPAGIRNAQSGIVVLNNCGGTLTVPQGSGSAQLEGGQIPPGESCDVVLKVVGAQAGHWTNNTGLVTSDNAAPGDNASASIDVLTLAPDLTIAKSHVGHFSRGQTGAVYKLIAQNSGVGSTVGLVSVSDTLPQGLTASDMSGPGWSCALNTLTCTRTDALPPGSSFPAITVTVDVAANAPATVTNMATVSGGGETNTANDVASDPTSVDAASTVGDLTLTKFHAGNFSQGQKGATFYLIAHNVGPIAASGLVTVADALPQGFTAKSMAGPGWTCTLAPLSCTRSDTLPAGASYPAITLTVDVDANAPAMLTNAASVSGGSETNTANNLASDPTSIDAASLGPDLTLTKSHAGTFSQGQTGASYSLVVHNVGAAATSGAVTVTDALPPSFTVIGMNGPGWSCTPSTKTCSRSDVLPASQDYPAITLSVFVASNAPSSIINWATVGGGGEANVNNDAAADPTSIDPASQSSDLTITKSHTGNFTQGQTGATYTLSVHNVGGAPTNGMVTVTDTLPASLTATSISGGVTWNCTLSPLQCTRSDVLFDGLSYPPITVTVDVAAGAPASVTNTAAVSGGGETNTGNDLANDPTTIVPNGTSVPDLTISKSHIGNFSQGQHGAVYTLLVQNAGSGATTGQVTVVDTLPPQGLTISDMHGANWACVPNTMSCTRSDALPAAGSYEAIQVVVDVATGAPPSVTNHASVSGGGETNVANDSASDVTTIDPFSVGPDLTIAKSHTGNFGQGETAAAYKLTVTNAGGGATTGTVSVTDALPQSLTIRSMEGQGWTCVVATKTCTRSDALNAGASYPDITLTADVATNAPASVTNTATVNGGGENNTANNTASDPTTIIPPVAGNHPPFGIGDAVQLSQGASSSEIVGDKNVVDSVIDNDADIDSGDVMHAVQISNPAHGTLVFHVDGTFGYTNMDNATTDSFTYKACDLFACSAPTTVTITIGDNLDNHAPFAVGDAIEVASHGASNVLVGDLTLPSSVLDNDIDFDADALTATKLSDPTHGTIDFQTNGTFSYQNDPVDPASGDGFLYELCDTHGACDLGVVTITIGNGPPNSLPTVVDDAVQVAPGQQADTLIGDLHVPASVLDNDTAPDGEPLMAKSSGLVSGSGTLVFNADGTFVYDNDPANPATSDSVLYQACDPRGACKAGLISITITSDAMDQLPSAQNDAIDVAAHGTATTLVGGGTRLTANDTDPDPGETAMLVAHVISAPANGHVTIQADGTFVYVNDDPSLGTDQFAYEACDPEGACDAATVIVTIDTTAPAVTCLLSTQVGVVGDAVSLDLSQLFSPPAGDTLTYAVTNPPPTLSLMGSLLGGTFGTAGTYISTLSASAVTGGGTASEDVAFQVLPVGEVLFRDGFDTGTSSLPCH